MQDYNDISQDAADQQKQYNKLLSDLATVLDNESGRQVLWYILSQCGVYDGTCTGDNHTFFLQGRRDIGLMIIGLLSDVDPTAYPKLQLRMAKDGRG